MGARRPTQFASKLGDVPNQPADNGDDKENLLAGLKEIQKQKKQLAAEAIRLKAAGRLSKEEEDLLKEEMGPSFGNFIPPDQVVQMFAEAGIPMPLGPDGLPPAPADGVDVDSDPDLGVDWNMCQEEIEAWQQYLNSLSEEELDMEKLLKKLAGRRNRPGGIGSNVERVSASDVQDPSRLDEDTVYLVEGATLEDFGVPGDLGEDPEPDTNNRFNSSENHMAMAAGMNDIVEEEGGETWEHTDGPPIGDGVEEYLLELETGKPIEIEDREGDLPRESLESFRSRLWMLRDHYEDQFRKPRDRKIPAEEARKLETEFNAAMKKKGVRFDGTTRIPADMSWDRDVRRQAPDPPPEVDAMIQRFHWILLLMRRSHLTGDPLEPGRRLLQEGLLSEDCTFGDQIMVLKGASRWLAMLENLKNSGAWTEAASVVGAQTADSPPRFYVVVDYFVNIRVPESLLQETHKPDIIWADRIESAATEEDAEAARRNLEDSMHEWHQEGEGCAWRDDPSVCTMSVTTKYAIDEAGKVVCKVDSCWGAVLGSVSQETFLSAYLEACGGISEDEMWMGETIEYLYHDPPDMEDQMGSI